MSEKFLQVYFNILKQLILTLFLFKVIQHWIKLGIPFIIINSPFILVILGSDLKKSAEENKTESYSPSKMEVLRSKLKTVQHLKDISQFGDSTAVATNLETVKDQLKYLKSAIESSLEISKKKISISSTDNPAESSANEAELVEAQDQVVKLKSLLSTKWEQIATRCTVLKANKPTAEVALAKLTLSSERR